MRIDDPGLLELYRSWQRNRGGKPLPTPLDLDLAKLPFLIWPTLGVIDVIRRQDTVEFRYGRLGLPHPDGFGCDSTGEFLDNALLDRDSYRDYVVGIYREAAFGAKPIYTENLVRFEGQAPMLTKRLCLPLSTDGTNVDMTLVARVFVYDPVWSGNAYALGEGFAETERRVLLS